MKIVFLDKSHSVPKIGLSTIYLTKNDWDDYSFKTSFYVQVHDEEGRLHDLEIVKIGFTGQTTMHTTYSVISEKSGFPAFEQIPEGFFSVGLDVEYYKKIYALPEQTRRSYLLAIKDIAFDSKLFELAQKEDVFKDSLLRHISVSLIKGQFARVIRGEPPLTDFLFKFVRSETEKMSEIELKFNVLVDSNPPTNIHAIIGRNGVGKTTLLNGMVEAITSTEQKNTQFYEFRDRGYHLINQDYFGCLVSISFSAFDPFEPPEEQVKPSLGTCYYYIGLRTKEENFQPVKTKLKSLEEIYKEFAEALKICSMQNSMRKRWCHAIETLESDENFGYLELKDLIKTSPEKLKESAIQKIKQMSSGHMIVLLTITKLVATVQEKTLVIFDEPESHLHPPLLSALIRALSDLLHTQNGVAIIATHSPVVLQEVPKSNIWKIYRYGDAVKASRPDIETFGENVGVLTREVFGLEVVKSGYHDLLTKSVEKGGSYQDIVEEYGEKLGLEARALLKVLVMERDRNLNDDED